MKERLVIGSLNQAKINEWADFFREFGLEVEEKPHLENLPEPEETGLTFIENARLKAAGYAKLLCKYVFADDGGYEIDALGGLPGVKSRRILPGDREGTDQELIEYVLEKMRGIPYEKRTVRLTSATALSDPHGKIIFEETCSSPGIIAEKQGQILISGYPFRSIHFLPELGKTYAELTEEEHKKYSHKRPVAEKLAKFLLEYKG